MLPKRDRGRLLGWGTSESRSPAGSRRLELSQGAQHSQERLPALHPPFPRSGYLVLGTHLAGQLTLGVALPSRNKLPAISFTEVSKTLLNCPTSLGRAKDSVLWALPGPNAIPRWCM